MAGVFARKGGSMQAERAMNAPPRHPERHLHASTNNAQYA
ncbi:hypothetical protein OKW41_001957 [Paraburkholderia sp. UCT70]